MGERCRRASQSPRQRILYSSVCLCVCVWHCYLSHSSCITLSRRTHERANCRKSYMRRIGVCCV